MNGLWALCLVLASFDGTSSPPPPLPVTHLIPESLTKLLAAQPELLQHHEGFLKQLAARPALAETETCPNAAIRHRMALLTEDRKETGCLLILDVLENMQIAVLQQDFVSRGFVAERGVIDACKVMSDKLRVKTPDLHERIENLSGGMGTAAFVAFLMSLCNQRFTATQYALLSAFASVGRVWVGPLAGVLAESIGWPTFFVVSTVAALPALLMLVWLRPSIRALEVDPATGASDD